MMNKFKYLISLLFVIYFGCVNPFAPELVFKDFKTSSILTEQKSPEDVLTNFKYAYTFKDSLIYSEIIDSSFIFISKNYSTDPPTDIIWGRDTELKTTAALFRHFDDLKLNWGSFLKYDFNSDSTSSEIKVLFSLTFDDGREIPTLRGESLFNFIKKKSGIWKIIRWEDLSSF